MLAAAGTPPDREAEYAVLFFPVAGRGVHSEVGASRPGC
jgi:hypothetical protein